MVAELRSEREQIEESILVLERLASGQGKRRGMMIALRLSNAGHLMLRQVQGSTDFPSWGGNQERSRPLHSQDRSHREGRD
jgi:hypothetical protein